MAQRLTALWLRNVLPAFAVLLVVKAALVAQVVGQNEGHRPLGELLPSTLLFLGWDVVGAALFAALVALVGAPLLLLGRRAPGDGAAPPRLPAAALALSAVLQAAHAVGVGFSYYTVVIVGGLITKSGLDLAFLGAGGDQEGIWSSVGHLVTVRSMAFLSALALLGAGGVLLAPRLLRRLGRRAGRLAALAALVLATLTTALLPHLTTGAIAGVRVDTHDLELSPGVAFAASYLAALGGDAPGPADAAATAWAFDLTPPGAGADASAAPPPLAGARPQRTNLVIVALESVSAPYVGPETMPFLFAAGEAADGVAFRQHYTPWPQTTKAFFSLLCSEWPHPHHLPVSARDPALPYRCLPEVLHAAGYHTALVTAADLAYERMIRFFERRHFDVIRDMKSMPGRETAWRNSWGVDERLAVANVLAEADAAGDRPFFVFYGMAVAHHPYLAAAEHEAAPLPDDRANYDRALRFIDERLRELHAGLAARGLADRTLLVIVADHGEGFGQHPGSQAHSHKVYQENVHVPWVVRGPQLGGLRRRSVALPTSHVDVASTLLGLLGLAPPCPMKGRDLTRDGAPRLVVLCSRKPGRQLGLVDGRLKYIRDDNGFERVFDVIADPAERQDLFAAHADRIPAWRARVLAWEAWSANLMDNYGRIAAAQSCGPP